MDPLLQADNDRLRILTRRKVSQLLGDDIINPFIHSEEQRHPWSVNKSQELDCPLLRIWDINSGSQPDEDNCMLSRSPNQPLDTEQVRKDSLAIHLYHKNRTPTPYISFTKSASAIKDLATLRMSRRRGVQTLTVIDPAARLRSGLPILDVAAEMEHYCIPDPYMRGSKYYIDHYVCLWKVTAEETVCHYEWEELAKTTNWYDEVIIPAFRRFSGRRRPESAPTRASAFDMSAMMEGLPIASKSITLDIEFIEDSDRSFEHDYLDFDNSTDSDDEVEEANQNDDIIKSIEGACVMRLLKCRLGDDGFELTTLDDNHALPYAILLHTWTADQEVTYKELLKGTGILKSGYAKLRFCGERAAADGLEYF
ncbi:hypothetical protein CC86DRAFT_471299 [Ophiobolus disseminans]|uniref:DUF7587 domain-containing protein n=1 Tax=Ophiobolus disseminans TaxID=1469910 RepID=A0A6A6ZIE7_9PLEO|nr:hypothetical protein CC86DRAFT_471299 [Ophiobolus disseminans]